MCDCIPCVAVQQTGACHGWLVKVEPLSQMGGREQMRLFLLQ